ncbi:hypothetical protein ACLIX5_004455 [Salmonella enterica subsp. enterica serovar Bredeney]
MEIDPQRQHNAIEKLEIRNQKLTERLEQLAGSNKVRIISDLTKEKARLDRIIKTKKEWIKKEYRKAIKLAEIENKKEKRIKIYKQPQEKVIYTEPGTGTGKNYIPKWKHIIETPVDDKHFNGKPCFTCGGTLRLISNRKCVACRARLKQGITAKAYKSQI